MGEEQMQELRKCEPDHKFLIENYVAPNDAWVFEFKYPEGAKMDSESFAVSPNGDKFWVIEKTTSSSARVFGRPTARNSTRRFLSSKSLCFPHPALRLAWA